MRGRYQTLSDKATEQLPLSAQFHPRAGSPPTALAPSVHCAASYSGVDDFPEIIWHIFLLLTRTCDNPTGRRQKDRSVPQTSTSSSALSLLQIAGNMRRSRWGFAPWLVLTCAGSSVWAAKRPFNIHDDILAYPQVRREPHDTTRSDSVTVILIPHSTK